MLLVWQKSRVIKLVVLGIVLVGLGIWLAWYWRHIKSGVEQDTQTSYQEIINTQGKVTNQQIRTISQVSNFILNLQERKIITNSPIALEGTALAISGYIPISTIGDKKVTQAFLIYGIFNTATREFHSAFTPDSAFTDGEAAATLLEVAYKDVALAEGDIFMGTNADKKFNTSWANAVGLASDVYTIDNKTYILPISVQFTGNYSEISNIP